MSDTFAHCQFIDFSSAAIALLQKGGVDSEADEGMIDLEDAQAIAQFVQHCRKLRLGSREAAIKLQPA